MSAPRKKAEKVVTGSKPGRRPVDGKTRDRLFQVRMSTEQLEEAEALAEEHGMTLPDWARARLCSAKAGA